MNNPRWLREFDASLQLSRQFVLWGNVRDTFLLEGDRPRILDIFGAIWSVLTRQGYSFLAVYDQVDGISLHEGSDVEIATKVLKQLSPRAPVELSLQQLGTALRQVAHPPDGARGAIVIDYASRLRGPGDVPTPAVHDFFVLCEKLSHSSQPVRSGRSDLWYNPIIWLLDKERDLPAWLVAGNEDVRLLPIPEPDLDQRAEMARLLLGMLPESSRPAESAKSMTRMAAITDRFTVRAMMDVGRIMASNPGTDVDDAVRAYTLGTDESPWRGDQLWTQIADAERDPVKGVQARVLGQPAAVTMALDVLKRSAIGLSGAQLASQPNRPRGVMFFAGPTGVGKTELAKALAQVVFGTDEAMRTFDMSEYRGSENAARLIGAPPGYTGHDAGGQLTNAMRERPFQLLLFDEIDNADQSIMDNFLQILDEGRLTDGRGATVYFAECLIIFTSNLGIYTTLADGTVVPNVSMLDGFDLVRTRVRSAIEQHFLIKLRRPELLNRIGQNIIVFDFIRPPIDRQIFDLMVDNVAARVRRMHGAELTIDPEVKDQLADWATKDLNYGGRGIGNRIETALVNPLARLMFDRYSRRVGPDGRRAPPVVGEHLRIRGASQADEIWTLLESV